MLRLEWINCTGRCLPCHWCRMEENIIEKSKKKKKKRREKEKEREEKKVVYLFQSAAY